MPASVTDLIKEKLDVVTVVKSYLELQSAGKNFKARCPFHHEKTPSFIVSPDRGTWHCFGCGLGGDIFTFVMRQENLEFPEALRLLAEKAGVELRRYNPAEERLIGVLYDLNEAAATFFENALATAAPTSPVKKYLVERGLSAETIKQFRIGWAPNDNEALNLHLLQKQFAPEDILRAGLGFKTERGLQMDRFRGRIMFPITNHLGKIVGFSGRILPQLDTGTMGKYVNSPETPIYNKSRLLYGFSLAKDAIRDARQAVLMEGQMDVVLSRQAGVTNAIAVLGTALTSDHLRTLGRIADTLVLAFDADDAGWQAADRAFDLARQHDFDVRMALIPDAKDPAELAQKNPEALRAALAKAPPALEVYMKRLLLPGASYENRTALQNLRLVLQKIAKSPSAVEREGWLAKISHFTNLSQQALREEMQLTATPATSSPSSQRQEQASAEAAAEDERQSNIGRPANRWETVAEQVLSIGFHANRMPDILSDHLPLPYQPLLTLLQNGAQKSTDPREDAVLQRIAFAAPTNDDTEENGGGLNTEFDALCEQLAREYLAHERRVITRFIKEAETRGDDEALREHLAALAKLPLQ